MVKEFDMPDPEAAIRNRILFDLLVRAHGKHWKFPFEITIVVGDKRIEPPTPKEFIATISKEFARAIEFFHGAAVTIDLEEMRARPVKGEATAYVFFDGYVLKIGSVGYQG